jgi:hypothetical protein
MARNAKSVPQQLPWQEAPESYRALVVRNRADERFVAIEQQHERVRAHCATVQEMTLTGISSRQLAAGIADVDFLVTGARRMLRVGELFRRCRFPTAVLRQPLRDFEGVVQPTIAIRDVMEHLDEVTVEGRGGIGYGFGADRLAITYNGVTVDTFEVYQASVTVHRAIRAVVDPLAVGDVHWHVPLVSLA